MALKQMRSHGIQHIEVEIQPLLLLAHGNRDCRLKQQQG